MSNFNFLGSIVASNGLTSVAKGTKTIKETRPELYTSISYGKMILNGMASKMLNVGHGDFITFFDVAHKDLREQGVEPTMENTLFFVVSDVAISADSLALANQKKAEEDCKLNFSTSSLYSRLLQNDVNALALGKQQLEIKGLLERVKTRTANSSINTVNATREVHFRIVSTGQSTVIPVSTIVDGEEVVENKTFNIYGISEAIEVAANNSKLKNVDKIKKERVVGTTGNTGFSMNESVGGVAESVPTQSEIPSESAINGDIEDTDNI